MTFPLFGGAEYELDGEDSVGSANDRFRRGVTQVIEEGQDVA